MTDSRSTGDALHRPRHRRTIRLKGYDYTQAGAYFVTICTQNRVCLFGDMVGGEMRLKEAGRIVRQCWEDISTHFPHVVLDQWVMMPNHVHGIIILTDVGTPGMVGATHASPLQTRPHGPQRRSIAAIVGSFKSAASRRINDLRGTPGVPVWQRNYYEHIVRDENSLNCIRQYILDNPVRWEMDRENPGSTQPEPENAWAT